MVGDKKSTVSGLSEEQLRRARSRVALMLKEEEALVAHMLTREDTGTGEEDVTKGGVVDGRFDIPQP